MSGILADNTGRASGLLKAAGGGGKVGQVVQQVYTATYSVTSQNAWGAMPTATLTITPTATSSKIFVMLQCIIGNNNWGSTRLYRDIGGAGVAEVSAAHAATVSARQGAWHGHIYKESDASQAPAMTNTYLDSPNTTSAIVYHVYTTNHSSDVTYMGRSYGYSDNFSSCGCATIWTGWEILA